jgi:predicted transport protein
MLAEMKAIDCPFTKIINGTTQFVIPVFQRDYKWTEAHCEQLWKDVIAIAGDSSDRKHFLGSVVYVSTGDTSAGFTRWLLIDGQQRVTTLTLLLIALRDHIDDQKWTGGPEAPTAKRVDAYFLKNTQEEGSREHKLVLRRHDQATLRALLDRDELPLEVSENIRDNYEFFRERLKDVSPDDVYRGVGRLVVVDVTLAATDDPQLVFESLNSTGMDLSQSDLIRNFILMRLPEREQTRLYESYWSKIENLFRGSENTFDAFIRDYIALRTQASKQERTDQIYFAFRRVFGAIGSHQGDLDTLLQDLLRFAKYHAAFSIGTDAPDEIAEPLARLRRQVDVPATLVMRLFECYDQLGSLSGDHFADAIKLVDSYVFRRAICGEQTRGYWQVFAHLAYRIDPDKPLESLTVGLARQRENYRFPDNNEFRRALEDEDIYGKRVCFDLLDRLENYDNKEPTDTSGYSIEHIMPRNENLVPEWRKMLGDHWRDVQRQWLHRLGNLTLTGYNSTYSDRPFSEKKSIAGGFEESSVRLNKYVREQQEWTPNEIERRGKELATRALSIWPMLVVDKALIDAAEEADKRSVAKQQDTGKVPMSTAARGLFDLLRAKVLEIDGDIIELAEGKSVSYHGPTFFLEVLPRKNRITLLLALDFNEADDASGFVQDASQHKFFVNAEYEGGVHCAIWGPEDIEKAIPIIRQAREMARI